jgi:hypothetical protein
MLKLHQIPLASLTLTLVHTEVIQTRKAHMHALLAPSEIALKSPAVRLLLIAFRVRLALTRSRIAALMITPS